MIDVAIAILAVIAIGLVLWVASLDERVHDLRGWRMIVDRERREAAERRNRGGKRT